MTKAEEEDQKLRDFLKDNAIDLSEEIDLTKYLLEKTLTYLKKYGKINDDLLITRETAMEIFICLFETQIYFIKSMTSKSADDAIDDSIKALQMYKSNTNE